MRLTLVIGAATKPGRLANALSILREDLQENDSRLEMEVVDLHASRLEMCDGRPDDAYRPETQAAVSAIGHADAVLLASPVYRASYPGVLKNLLDLLPVDALRDKPVGIVAMGGSAHHYLGVDWQLRAVLSWFGALAMPTSVYLTSSDFEDGRLQNIQQREALAALAKACVDVADRMGERGFGPAPLAARWS